MSLKNLITYALFSLVFISGAAAQCAAPSSPGVKICFPTEGSTVMYVPALEMADTTDGAAIARVEVWDNGSKRDNFSFLPGTLFDGSMKNGTNRVTVKAWDTSGKLYQATRTFFVAGYGVDVCPTPSAPGINLCWPTQGSTQPNDTVPISASARGNNSKIKFVNVYVDGKFLVGQPGNFILTGAGVSAGTHSVTARAVDDAGHVFTASHRFKAYYNFDCNPRTGVCSPGVVINEPQGQDVASSFTVQADVQNNPKPITAMKVYVDGVVKATSGGPGITVQLNLPVNSTHIVWVKAWDSVGNLYAAFQTCYVH